MKSGRSKSMREEKELNAAREQPVALQVCSMAQLATGTMAPTALRLPLCFHPPCLAFHSHSLLVLCRSLRGSRSRSR